MNLHIHLHHSWDEAPQEITDSLSLIIRNQELVMTTQDDIAVALAKVQEDVAAQTTVQAGVAVYIKGLQDQIAALAAKTTDTTTAAALTVLAGQIEANTAADANAIASVPPATPVAPVV
jgi:hypothetical protein